MTEPDCKTCAKHGCEKPRRKGSSYCRDCSNSYHNERYTRLNPPVCIKCKQPRDPAVRLCDECARLSAEKERQRSRDRNAAAREKREKIRAEKERREAALKESRVNMSPESKAQRYQQRKAGEGVALLERKHLDIDARINVIGQVDDLRTQGRHLEAIAIHCQYFDTPYRETPTPARIGTGNKPG